MIRNKQVVVKGLPFMLEFSNSKQEVGKMGLIFHDQLYGYTGKLLKIDLSKEKISVEGITPDMLRKFLGRRVNAALYLGDVGFI